MKIVLFAYDDNIYSTGAIHVLSTERFITTKRRLCQKRPNSLYQCTIPILLWF